MRVKKENGIAKANSSFIVKVQVFLEQAEAALKAVKAGGWSQLKVMKDKDYMMVYDQARSFQWMIEPDCDGYDELLLKVLSDGFRHVKGYFNAKAVNGNLSINVQDIRRPRPW